MSTKGNSDIIICDRKLYLDIILPEEVDDIKEKIEKELGLQCGEQFLPYNPMTSDFGPYGRRWHIKVAIAVSQEQEFCASLRRFCEKYNLSLDENAPNNNATRQRFAAYCPKCGEGTNGGEGTGKYLRFYGEGPEQVRYKCEKCGHEWHNFEDAVEC